MNYHSITFGDKNTWTDWHLVPSTRPVVNPPKPKTQYVDIPGADGSIDLTDSLAGRPVFSDREGSFDFIVLNDYNIDNYDYNWIDVYTEILQYLHGRRMTMFLEDDPEYYYEGRFEVNNWTTDANNSTISINYVLNPYKYRRNTPFTAAALENGVFGVSGKEGESGYTIREEASDVAARLRSTRSYVAGDIIRVDRTFRFDLALYNKFTYASSESYPDAKKFIEASSMINNEFKFSDSGYYRLEIYYASGHSGRALTDDDLTAMAAAVHYYSGGTL